MMIVTVRILNLKIGHSFEMNPCSSKQEFKILVPCHFSSLLVSSDSSSIKDPNRGYYSIYYISCLEMYWKIPNSLCLLLEPLISISDQQMLCITAVCYLCTSASQDAYSLVCLPQHSTGPHCGIFS